MKILSGVILTALFIYAVAEILLGNAPMAIFLWIVFFLVIAASSTMLRPIKRASTDHVLAEQPPAYSRTATRNRSQTHYTKAEWRALCEKYGNRCAACKRKRRLTVDHVIPFAAGGSDDISNVQPLCQPCNSRKGTKITDYRNE